MLKLPIYLDYNSTTPCDRRVVEAMLPYFTDQFGNAASRSHGFGWAAEEAVEYAREQVAKLMGSEPKEIIFTSGATEADNLAIKGVFETYASKGNHIITAATEHKAVLDSCKHMGKLGAIVTYLPVGNDGLVDLNELESSIKDSTILVAIMYANNETGVIQPIKQISEIVKSKGVLFFTDAVQAAGKIAIDVMADGIDLLSISAHKMYGPKGVGALYVRRKNPRVKLSAQIDGGGHERGMRSGTLNVPGIVGFGKAAELCRLEMEGEAKRLSVLRDRLEAGLLQTDKASVNGTRQSRLPNVTNISFADVEGEGLLMGINKNIALSSGSACTSASLEPSYVLKAMGLGDQQAYGSIRFSVGRFTTDEEIDYTIDQVNNIVTRLKLMSAIVS